MSNANALSQLQPAQVRTLREGFQILDRDSDGFVNRDDVADMLNQLGEFCYISAGFLSLTFSWLCSMSRALPGAVN